MTSPADKADKADKADQADQAAKAKPTTDPRPGAAAAPARHAGKVKNDHAPANHPGHTAAEESEYQRINIPDSRSGKAPAHVRGRDDRAPKQHK